MHEQSRYTEAQMTAAKAERYEAGRRDGRHQAITAERTRLKSILTSEHAQGRTEMAQQLAFDTDLSADQAAPLMARTPQTIRDRLSAAIAAAGGSPNVGADPIPSESADAYAKRIASYANNNG